MKRVSNVVRMQLINRETYIWSPLIILGGAFLITLAIYGIILSAGVDGDMYGGGAQAPLWYFAIVGVQALTLTFPFSQAMSVTRREFYLGTLLTAALTAGILAIVFVIGGLVEELTGGWGFGGYFFYLPWVWEAGPLGAAAFFFILAMVFFVIGFAAATIFKRFGMMVLSVVLITLTLLLLGAIWLITANGSWMDVWAWFAEAGVVGLTLWGALLTAVLGVLSYFALRRAVPER